MSGRLECYSRRVPDPLQIVTAISLCEDLVPAGRFTYGDGDAIECSKTSEQALRRVARRQAKYSTLTLVYDSSQPLKVMGIVVRSRR